MIFRRAITCALICLAGCMDALQEDVKPTGSIIGKKTQKIGEFNPNAEQKVSDSKVRVETPGLHAMEAYGPALEQITKSHIEHAVNLFNASEGRYPKDHQEFMDRIIKENNIQLPVLPGGAQYMYDVKNHKLEVVIPTNKGADKADKAAKPSS